MIESFDDLYDQIVRCERRIEERQRLQSELRGQVQNCKDTLQRLQDDQSRLQKELSLKVEQLSAAELDHTSLTARENVLVIQRDGLQEEQSSLQQRLASLEEEIEREIVSFCQYVESHSEELDLSTAGQRARQNKAAITLEQLLATEQTLLKDIAEYEMHKETVSQLEADRYCLQQSLADAVQTKKELEECLAKEQETLQQLEEERQHVSKIPHWGEEFNRLRSELTSLHTGSLEEQCSQLQHQVHTLQQQLYGRQQQQLRQQLQRQQQQPTEQEIQTMGDDETPTVTGILGTHDNSRNMQLVKTNVSMEDDFDNDDDDMTLPDLDLSEAERLDRGSEGLRVCNRQKPVFKPLHC